MLARSGRPHSIAREPLQDSTMRSGRSTQAIAGCNDEVGRKPHLTKNGKIFLRKISFVLLSQDSRQPPSPGRHPHRHRRTHRVPLRVQQDYEVTTLTLKHRETEAISRKSKNNKKKGDNHATRSRLRDLPEWLQVFTENPEDTAVPALANFCSRKTEMARFASEPRLRGLFAGGALAKPCLEQKTKVI